MKRMLAYLTNHSYTFQVGKTVRLSEYIIIHMINPHI